MGKNSDSNSTWKSIYSEHYPKEYNKESVLKLFCKIAEIEGENRIGTELFECDIRDLLDDTLDYTNGKINDHLLEHIEDLNKIRGDKIIYLNIIENKNGEHQYNSDKINSELVDYSRNGIQEWIFRTYYIMYYAAFLYSRRSSKDRDEFKDQFFFFVRELRYTHSLFKRYPDKKMTDKMIESIEESINTDKKENGMKKKQSETNGVMEIYYNTDHYCNFLMQYIGNEYERDLKKIVDEGGEENNTKFIAYYLLAYYYRMHKKRDKLKNLYLSQKNKFKKEKYPHLDQIESWYYKHTEDGQRSLNLSLECDRKLIEKYTGGNSDLIFYKDMRLDGLLTSFSSTVALILEKNYESKILSTLNGNMSVEDMKKFHDDIQLSFRYMCKVIELHPEPKTDKSPSLTSYDNPYAKYQSTLGKLYMYHLTSIDNSDNSQTGINKIYSELKEAKKLFQKASELEDPHSECYFFMQSENQQNIVRCKLMIENLSGSRYTLKRLEKKIEKTQKETIALFGLFTSLLTFIMGSLNIITHGDYGIKEMALVIVLLTLVLLTVSCCVFLMSENRLPNKLPEMPHKKGIVTKITTHLPKCNWGRPWSRPEWILLASVISLIITLFFIFSGDWSTVSGTSLEDHSRSVWFLNYIIK